MLQNLKSVIVSSSQFIIHTENLLYTLKTRIKLLQFTSAIPHTKTSQVAVPSSLKFALHGGGQLHALAVLLWRNSPWYTDMTKLSW